MLARMVWGTYAVKIEVQIGNCLSAPECPVDGGGGCNRYLGNAPLNLETISGGLSLPQMFTLFHGHKVHHRKY